MKEKWWKNAIVYQIYPKSFQDTNGDGIGDLRGIINRLDYIKNLGADTIWLCPINVSPMMDNGYDIADYYNVDPDFGTNEDLEELVEAAKKRGIKVLMDLVVNHCSSEHAWFKEAVRDPKSKYASYFIIEETDGKEPNNMRCYAAASAWERIGDSNRFYFHSFSREQPDLNWENPELRKEIIEMMKFWQKKGIAGFRIDAIGNIKKSKEALEQKPIPTDSSDGMASMEKHVLMQNGIEEYLRELKEEVFDKYDMMTVAEVDVPEEKMERFIGKDGLFSMVFDFSYTDIDIEKRNGKEWKRDWSIKELKEKIFKSQNAIQKYGWGSPYLENHDQPRSIDKYVSKEEIGYESKTALGALYFFLRGTPFIYQGQEIGMLDFDFTRMRQLNDVESKNVEKILRRFHIPQKLRWKIIRRASRDNARTPFQWTDGPNGGFTDGRPWLGVNHNCERINLAQQEADPDSIWSWYKALSALRRETEVLRRGTFEPLEAGKQVFAYRRASGEDACTVVLNFSDQPAEAAHRGAVMMDNYGRETFDGRMQPWEAVILRQGN